MQTIEIIAGGQTFTAALNGSKAAQALAAKLPLTITMQELHGNEKYHYFSDTLPADAQRVGTIMNADRIIVLEDGKIAGMGTHRQLLENCEVYRQIAYSQLSKEDLEA